MAHLPNGRSGKTFTSGILRTPLLAGNTTTPPLRFLMPRRGGVFNFGILEVRL